MSGNQDQEPTEMEVKSTRKLAAVQIAYMVARATVDTLRDQAADELAFLNVREPETFDECNTHGDLMAAIDAELGLPQAEQELGAAERALLAWGQLQARRARGYAPQATTIAALFERAERDWKVREKLIDLCLRLDA